MHGSKLDVKRNIIFAMYRSSTKALTPDKKPLKDKTVRVPDEIYEVLREIKLSLENKYQSAAPTVQDLITVALIRFVDQWRVSGMQDEILAELLSQRRIARSKMGNRKQKD